MTETPDRFEQVRAEIHELMTAANIPSLAVAVAQGENIVWEEGFGLSDPHTLYSIASVSKPITATALMILVQRGLLDLDRPMDDYLGRQKLTACAGPARDATVRRVANHTAGLPLHYQFFYADEPVVRPSMDESIARYGVIVRPPGESFVYSNFGYALLEYAIERLSGKSYAEFLRDELFEPLRMAQSTADVSPAGDRVALRYRAGRRVPSYDFDHRGGSAVYMSAHDLVRFGMFHLRDGLREQNRAILASGTFQSMLEQPVSTTGMIGVSIGGENSRYGIGWIVGEKHGLKHVGHSGGMPGVAARLSLYPEKDTAISVVANAEAAGVYSLEESIVHALYPDTIRHDRDFNPQPEWLGRWVGAVHTYAGSTPLAIQFHSDGSVHAQVGTSPPQEVIEVKYEPKTAVVSLKGIRGEIGAPDAARYPYKLNFTLTWRMPDILNGSVCAVSQALPDRWGSALSYWVDLRKTAVT